MKKIIITMLLLSSVTFASEFKYYQGNIKNCVNKLNELRKDYHIISYQILQGVDNYNMIIEVERKGEEQC